MSVFLFIFILCVLVLVHEAGHFFVAKFFGIRVDEFGIGYPPRAATMFSWKGTLFTANWLPFGGFVKIFGEDGTDTTLTDEEKKQSFAWKPRYAQALVLIAGVTMNFILGWFLLSLTYLSGMPTIVGSEPTGGTITNPVVMVTGIQPGSPAEEAGLRPGDTLSLFEIQNEKIQPTSVFEVKEFIGDKAGQTILLTIERKGVLEQKEIIPKEGVVEGNGAAIGIALDLVGTLELPWYRAPIAGFEAAINMTKSIVVSFGTLIGQLFVGRADLSQITGPVGIVGVVGDAYEIGFVYVLSLAALISLNLTVINLIPFPALDGGRLLFVGIEALIRRPIPTAVSNVINLIGFGLLILLMLVVTYQDIVRLIK